MSWEQLDASRIDPEARERQANKQREDMEALTKAYYRCFSTEDGIKVMEDLSKKFIMGNDTPFDASNIEYQAAYHNGETGVVKFMIEQINRSSKLV
jgi:hypothetical protein